MKNMEDMDMEDLQQNVKTICDGVLMPVDAMQKEEFMTAWKL